MKTILITLSILLIVFGCSTKDENANTITLHDTIIIKDSILFLSTNFIKNSNDENAISPVDTILQKCMTEKANSTTSGMIDCYNEASKILLLKLKLKEDSLINFLNPKHGLLIKKSQENWRRFLESEEDFLYQTYYTWANHSNYPSLGREASIDQAEWKYKIIRDRVIALENYYNRVYYERE